MRRIYFVLIVLLTFSFANSADAGLSKKAKIRYTKSYGRKYFYLKDVASFYGMKYWQSEKYFKMFSKYSSILLTFKKREAKINDIAVHLSYAPFIKKKGSYPVISQLDFNSVLEPILRKSTLKKHTLKTILIDPGHGKKDTGAVGKKYKEKNINLKISKKLAQILIKAGYTVYMTRTNDKFIKLEDRVKMGDAVKADLFVSIHCNAASASANGIETYAATQLNAPATISSKASKKKSASNAFTNNNSRLAYEVQKQLVRRCKGKDRGVRKAGFLVIKKSARTSILVECGFLSNKKEELKLGDDAYQNQLVSSIALGIVNYHKAILK